MKSKWILWLLIAVAAAILLWRWSNSQPLLPSYDGGQYSSPSPTASVKASSGKSTPKTNTSSGGSASSYSELVKAYEGKRIQFDESCRMTPPNITYKNGTAVLLDNRSNAAKTITIGGTKYTLGAYGYRVVTLSSSKLPATLGIDCGGIVNTGTILLQATILNQ